MTSSQYDQEFTLHTSGTLIDDYDRIIKDNALNLMRIAGNDLDYMVEKNKYHTYPMVLPHIYEIIWMMWNRDMFSNRLANGKTVLWSQTATKSWNPMEQKDKPMLFVASMQKDKAARDFDRYDIIIEKAGVRFENGTIIFLPDNKGVLRSLKADDDSIAAFQSARQFPREFFEHAADWKAFNRYSAMLDVNRTLTSG
jgi:hypothetical protein